VARRRGTTGDEKRSQGGEKLRWDGGKVGVPFYRVGGRGGGRPLRAKHRRWVAFNGAVTWEVKRGGTGLGVEEEQGQGSIWPGGVGVFDRLEWEERDCKRRG
jgi:hypothetical protein